MKFRQVGLHITDLNRAVAFYSRILEKEPMAVFETPGFAFFDLEGVRLFLDINAPKSAIYLELGDVREVVQRIRNKGVTIKNEPHVVFPDADGVFDQAGNEWLAFFEDSEGNLVGLMSREAL